MTRFLTALLKWYRRHRRDLPWRRTRNPYRIFVSEVMLQQTQVSAVIPYYGRFLKAFPTVHALARARKDRLMKLWEGLGYYARARNLQAAAKRIVTDHGGRIPRDPETFSKLPGAGPYTTAAVLSIAFGAAEAAVDGNVKRVVSRLFDIDRPLKPDDPEIRTRARRLMGGNAGTYNQAMMELGATLCLPKRPACLLCPVRAHCRAFKAGTVEHRPVVAARKARPHLRVVAGILKKNGDVLIGRRPDRGLLGGLWEFPGGKVRRGETLQKALEREFREELGIDVEAGKPVAKVEHAYTHFTVTLHGLPCTLRRGTPAALVHSAIRWTPPAALGRYAMPEANRKLWRELSGRKITLSP